MACSDYSDPFKFLTDFSAKHPFDLVFCPFSDVVGPAVFTLFVVGLLMVMYYVSDDTVVVPVTLAILAGASLITMLPASAINLLLLAFTFGVAAGLMYLYHRSRPIR